MEALNRWLPSHRHRLLWVDHWDLHYPNTHGLFVAARAGLGETRSLSETPGHYFAPYPYEEQDQTKISPEHAQELGILIGLMSLLMMNDWDGWLVADGCSDRIEFWEGYFFFHSSEPARLAEAEAIISHFGCPKFWSESFKP
jgi:hypothetical protein